MARRRKRLGLALAMAVCAVPPSSASGLDGLTVAGYTQLQLTAAASTLVQARSQALVQKARDDHQVLPGDVLGVTISPGLARVQERAVSELENRNRAPVEGGPAYTGARTRLDAAPAVRTGDRITMEVTEHTEVRYGTGKVTQSVRRRFDFVTRGERITLTGEQVMDAGSHPFNDPDPRSR